jgi:uncharacterized iron-regulated membrane protein
MKTFRTVLFWMHLAAGAAAGLVVLIMCVTGVALTYEKQLVEWSDRRAWTAPSPDARRLPPETLLAKVVEAQPGAAPTGLTLRADSAAPATVTLDANKSWLVDPYTGAIIGEPPAALRGFFRTMTSWHRYLAMQGERRATGRMFTGASNLLFLFIVLSGMYLWLPRMWTWLQFKHVLWFRRGLPGKARDFNWHNVIGIWSAVPLAIVVAGAVPISYPWASDLVYRLAGDAPPPRPGGPGAALPAGSRNPRDERRRDVSFDGVNAGWERAAAHVAQWRSITVRIGGERAPLVYTVDTGYGGQPDKRGTLTVSRTTGGVETWETFEALSPGRRLRSWLRFAHTGEIYGLTGQTIAGLVSFGGAVLVYTGLALALRRLIAWLGRRKAAAATEEEAARAA